MKNNQNIFKKLDKNIGQKLSIGIARSLWNQEITDKLYHGCISTLTEYGVRQENIKTFEVGGSFELIYAASYMQDQTIDSIACLDAIILIGSIIKGETPHFEFISQSIINGVKDLNIKKDAPPIILSISTDFNQQQALDRAGGKYGNKGSDGALTALHLISEQHKLFYSF
tara:strand:+ start:168 stop:677 length:510 start_codon:yes stop_codon:yes gene_type:complete